jgi:hypothetical protein
MLNSCASGVAVVKSTMLWRRLHGFAHQSTGRQVDSVFYNHDSLLLAFAPALQQQFEIWIDFSNKRFF